MTIHQPPSARFRCSAARPKLALVVTVPITVRTFLKPHLAQLVTAFDVTLFCNFGDDRLEDVLPQGVRTFDLDLRRQISIVSDVKSIRSLIRSFRCEQFDAVQTFLPKGGLVGILSAFLARVPVRVHHFGGQVWFNKHGPMRWLLRTCDHLIGRLATECTVDGPSQQQFVVSKGICRKARFFGPAGSLSGVDCTRFRPDAHSRQDIRASLGIDEETCVIGFVGRINRDKGLLDLVDAFARGIGDDRASLVIIGVDEEELVACIVGNNRKLHGRIHFIGAVRDPERWFTALDIVCLPSYREGFGLVMVEAGACGKPVLASRITGLVDAVEEGVTGLLHEAGNVEDLRAKLAMLVANPGRRKELGVAGQARAHEHFSPRLVVDSFIEGLKNGLREAGRMP